MYLPGQVFLPKGTPLFEAPVLGSRLLGVTGDDVSCRSVESRLSYHRDSRPNYICFPLESSFVFHRIEAEGRQAWASPDLSMKPGLVIEPSVCSQSRFSPLAVSSLCGLLLCLAAGWRRLRGLFAGSCDWRTAAYVIGALLFLRQLFAAWYLLSTGNVVHFASDENSYFRIANDLLNLRWGSEPWNYTLGHPLLYVPFAVLYHATRFDEMREAFTLFNAFVVSPCALALVFLITRRLSGSCLKAAAAVLILMAVPVFYYPLEVWDPICFRAFFVLPGFDMSSFRPAYLFTWLGFNGMSDIPSTCLVLLCVWLALSWSNGLWRLALVSALFGLACLLRINNIFFSPLLAYLFFASNREELRSPSFFAKAIGFSLLAFLACFSPQLAVNFHDFGSVFTMPYSLHEMAKDGFSMVIFPRGKLYLTQTNLLYVCLGLSGMFFISDRFKRVVFILWALPLLVFFCGYACVSASPIRFILSVYGALLGAFVCADVWDFRGERWRLAFVTAAIGLNLVLLAPPFEYLSNDYKMQPLWIGGGLAALNLRVALAASVPALTMLLGFFVLRGSQRLLAFLFVFLLLFYSGSGDVLFLAVCLLLLWALFDIARELKEWLFGRNSGKGLSER